MERSMRGAAMGAATTATSASEKSALLLNPRAAAAHAALKEQGRKNRVLLAGAASVFLLVFTLIAASSPARTLRALIGLGDAPVGYFHRNPNRLAVNRLGHDDRARLHPPNDDRAGMDAEHYHTLRHALTTEDVRDTIPEQCRDQTVWPAETNPKGSEIVIFRAQHPTKGRRECDVTRCNHAQYAALHGYRFFEHVVEEDLTPNEAYRKDSTAPEVFYMRYAALIEAFKMSDKSTDARWFMMVDCDVVFTDLRRSVEDLIDAATDAAPENGQPLEYIVARDPLWTSLREGGWSANFMHNDVMQVNGGLQLAHKSRWTSDFFERVFECDPAKTVPEAEQRFYMEESSGFWQHVLGDQICLTYLLATTLPGLHPTQFMERAPDKTVPSLTRFGPAAVVSQRVMNAFDCVGAEKGCHDHGPLTADDLLVRPEWYRPGDWMIHYAGQHGSPESIRAMHHMSKQARDSLASAGGKDAKATYPLTKWDEMDDMMVDENPDSLSLGEDENPSDDRQAEAQTHTQLVKDYVTPSMMNGESQNSGPCSSSLSVCPQCVCVRMYNDGKEAEVIDGPLSGSFVRGGSVRDERMYPYRSLAGLIEYASKTSMLYATRTMLTQAGQYLNCPSANVVFFPADQSIVSPQAQKALKRSGTPLLMHETSSPSLDAIWMPDFIWMRSKGFTDNSFGDVQIVDVSLMDEPGHKLDATASLALAPGKSLHVLSPTASMMEIAWAWEKKIPKVFWRGSSLAAMHEGVAPTAFIGAIANAHDAIDDSCSRVPRVQLALRSENMPDGIPGLDAALSSLDVDGNCNADDLRALNLSLDVQGAGYEPAWEQHRAVIDIAAAGSLSDRYLRLASTSVVIILDSKIKGWYSHKLKPWVHYVPATPEDLHERVAWVLDDANRDDQHRMIHAANSLVRSMTFDAEAARIGKAVSYMTCKPEN